MLDIYRFLPVFGDIKEGLAGLQAAGFRNYAFSNARAEAVVTLLHSAFNKT